ncbi:MAG: hypothetical protein ACOYNS_13690 [Bacteroidota bacterium]
MKHNIVLTILLIISFSIAAAQTATAPANPGDADGGTSANPCQIATLENLYWLSQNSSGYGASKFVQTAGIDAASSGMRFLF